MEIARLVRAEQNLVFALFRFLPVRMIGEAVEGERKPR
jgi:hypothetical protein